MKKWKNLLLIKKLKNWRKNYIMEQLFQIMTIVTVTVTVTNSFNTHLY